MKKSNIDLARKIIEQHGHVKKDGEFYAANLDSVIGMSLGSDKKKKSEAVDHMVEQLAGELESGALQLADDWSENNLKPEK